LIDAHSDGVICIHNQESREEDKYYLRKEGGVQDLLHTLGIDDSLFTPSGHSSLQTYLEWLSPTHPFIFVHNTYTSREDVQYAHKRLKQAYWCFCPNANLYIENTLPDIDMFISEGARICIGTDSLASNHSLSILSELQSIKKHYLHISWEILLQWATSTGAQALGMQGIIGNIEPGKKPGMLHITSLDNAHASVKRIV
jgi:cytosine/adenosine deaminase-related metal-dependent hydrolase